MTSPSDVAGVFDRAAGTYDAVGVPWFGPIAQGLVGALDPQPGERVVDLGCGRGAALRLLAEAVGAGGRAVGIDLAPQMVQLTARDLARLPQVEVRVGDAGAPALAAGAFDVVASSLVLFFLPDPGAALVGWRELLVRGGRLGVSTFGAQDERWQQVDAVFRPYLPPSMADARTTGRRGPFASDAGVESLLTAAGLTDVRTIRRSVEARFRDAGHLVEFSWSHGQRAMWEAVPADQHAAVRAEIAAVMESFDLGSAPFTFRQDVRYTLGRRS